VFVSPWHLVTGNGGTKLNDILQRRQAESMSPDSWVEFIQSHPILAIFIIVAFGISAYLKPKPMFKLMAVVLVIGAMGYVVSFLVDLTSTGIDETTNFMSKPEK
jgi:hypothetical protein